MAFSPFDGCIENPTMGRPVKHRDQDISHRSCFQYCVLAMQARCGLASGVFGQQPGNVAHPTEKAISIIKPLVEKFSPSGGMVLDAFSGSGSTLVAAALAGRRYIGVELKEKYCRLSRRRLAGVDRYMQNKPQRPAATGKVGAPEALSKS
jgi:DNA modification methylase